MRHKLTSFFLSGLYLTIESLLAALCFYAKIYFLGIAIAILIFLEAFRAYRKVQFVRIKDHLAQDEMARKRYDQQQQYGHYFNIWYRFADSSDHEFIAQKFHSQIRKLRH